MANENDNDQNDHNDGNDQKTPEQLAEEQKLKDKTTYKNDLLKFKAEAKTAREERDAATAKLATNEEESLKKQNNYKDLYEREKVKREESETKYQTEGTAFVETQKHQAIREEAIKAGIIDSAIDDLEFLDNTIVEIETTSTGKLNVIGAKEFIEDLKSRKVHWFKEGSINLDNDNPNFGKPKTYTGKELLDLQRKEPLKYKIYMDKRLKG